MRPTWLAVALLAAGCFSESPSSSGCFDGEAACDCKMDGTCNEGLECVASIDKCVPTGCTPGDESCTCVDGNCLTGLVCSEGVCVPPSAATTGGDPSMSGPISDTVADTGPDVTTMSATSASSDPTDSDPTIPPAETGTSDPTDATDPMTDAASSDPSDPSMTDASVSVSASEGGVVLCPDCIVAAGDGMCAVEHNDCATDAAQGGCSQLMECILNFQDTLQGCCESTATMNATFYWNTLVDCAQSNGCAGECQLLCVD